MEGRTRRRTAQLFDLVEGTSTFGILALGLTVPKSAAAPLYTAGQLLEMDEREGPRIFSRSAWHRLIACGNLTREKYPHEGIESPMGILRRRTAKWRRRGCLGPELRDRAQLPLFFKSSNARDRPAYEFPARAAARATSAAPTYFQP